jgi:hypothetical protein
LEDVMLGITFKRWNWIDDGVIPLAAILMTASWAYPLFSSFMRSPQTGVQNPGFGFGLCLGLLVAGYLAGRLASQNTMGIVIVVVGGLTAILVSLMLIVPSDGEALQTWFVGMFHFVERSSQTGEILPAPLVTIILATVLWVRGVRLASIRQNGAANAFVVGIVAMAGLLLVSAILPSGTGSAASSGSGTLSTLATGLAPLFLISIPVAIVLTILAPALGEWATTGGEIAMVSGLLFLNLILPFGPSAAEMMGWLLLFLASGLATLALASVSNTLQEQERLTGIQLRVDRYWVLIMLLVVATVLVGGLLLGQIIAPRTVLRALSLLLPIWRVIRQVLLYVIFIFAYLFFSLIEPLLADLQQRPARETPALPSPVQPESLGDVTRQAAEFPPIFSTILQVILILGVIGIIGLLFYLAARSRERRARESDEIIETRETVLSVDLLREQLRGLWDALRRVGRESFFVDLGPESDPRRAVREMYQHVMDLAIKRDLPRQKQQTPATYSPTLASLCPEEHTSVEELTQIYAVARYGMVPPTEAQVRSAREAFARIESALRRYDDLA